MITTSAPTVGLMGLVAVVKGNGILPTESDPAVATIRGGIGGRVIIVVGILVGNGGGGDNA